MDVVSLQEYLSAPYQGASSFLAHVLFPIFGQERFTELYETEILDRSEAQSSSAGIRSIKAIGKLTIGIEPLCLFDVTVAESVRMERNRVDIQRLVRRLMEYHSCAFILFHYDSDAHTDWRFSYCHKGEYEGEVSDPKRYTFLLGPGQSCRTASENFMALYAKRAAVRVQDIETAFSVEALTRAFYSDLLGWYDWARDPRSGVTFPNNVTHPEDDRDGLDLQLIRLITRLMFVWFIKEKGLVPPTLFEEEALRSVLKDFEPFSHESSQYYQAILQNLFFATLNREITDETGAPNRGFAERVNKRDIKTLYRYEEHFSLSKAEIVSLFSEVPFLNGGLFECLDKTKEFDGEEVAYNIDGFSRNARTFANGKPCHRAFVPNVLFFAQKAEHAHDGLFSILNRYNFTVEENTPLDQQVALDPELLGKVFENLLGTYNHETQDSARKQKGAFYTPREIVNYMVDRSLRTALGERDPLVRSLFSGDEDLAAYTVAERGVVIERIKSLRILDPACGSGAFPMGMLGRMIELVQRLDPGCDVYTLKLELIENCIYGVDIEPIAVQITKLRFFISLICDCDRRSTNPIDNYGIPPLPNLETKFVVANTLVRSLRAEEGFHLHEVDVLKGQLTDVRHQHFRAKTAKEKRGLREKDLRICTSLSSLLEKSSFGAIGGAAQLVAWNPYDQNAVSPFFDPEWMFGIREGFDVVIGNPPYVQLQDHEGALAKRYEKEGYQTFARTGDLYCLFYERGWELLKEGGHLCYITSNKWMRAGYGKRLRAFLSQKSNPLELIDFAGVKIFESATVDTNILLFSKSRNEARTMSTAVYKWANEGIQDLSQFVARRHLICEFCSSESWLILSPIEQRIKRKIEAVGTPLREWDIRINYGIKTGYNPAFIVTTAKRDEILGNCQTEDERARTAALIRPILRGQDIARWGVAWAGLWLIATHNGIPNKMPRINLDEYPAVRTHLDQYWERLASRIDKGETPYNLRNCAYMDDFSKPKIVYTDIMSNRVKTAFPAFTYDQKAYLMNTAYLINSNTENLLYLLGVLNSKVGHFIIQHFVAQLGDTSYRLFAQYVIKFPIVRQPPQEKAISTLVAQLLEKQTPEREAQLNALVGEVYGLNENEKQYIENL